MNIKEFALKKFANEENKEALAESFERGFRKIAEKNGDEKYTFGSGLSSGLAKGIGSALGGLLVGGVALGGAHLYNKSEKTADRSKFLASLEKAINSTQILRDTPRSKVVNFANTIFNFAPSIASDPNLLSSVLSNVVIGDSIDPQTIKMLTELESKYKENTSTSIRNFSL
jgi:hypothetical protein